MARRAPQLPVALLLGVAASLGAAVAFTVAKQRRRRRKACLQTKTSQSSSNLTSKLKADAVVNNSLAGPLLKHLEDDLHLLDSRLTVVGIGGGSGSGKTTLAQAVYESLGRDNVTYLCHDSYYRDLSHLPPAERALNDFDDPASLQTELLVEHLRRLKRGEEVDVPVYDFGTHSRTAEVARAVPRRVVILEGILIFADPILRSEIDIKIFVDTDADLRFIRRLKRDMEERGRSAEGVIAQYLETVKPAHEQFVEPSRRHCNLIVPMGLNDVVLDMMVSHLRDTISAAEARSEKGASS